MFSLKNGAILTTIPGTTLRGVNAPAKNIIKNDFATPTVISEAVGNENGNLLTDSKILIIRREGAHNAAVLHKVYPQLTA